MSRLWRTGAAGVVEVGVIGCVVDELLVDSRGFLLTGQAEESSLVFVVRDGGANPCDPFLSIAFSWSFEAIVCRWGKDAENMSPGGSGRFDGCDGGHFGERHGDTEAGGLLVLVHGKEVWSEDEVGGFPRGAKDMFVLDSTADPPRLQDAIEFEAPILVDGGKWILISIVARAEKR